MSLSKIKKEYFPSDNCVVFEITDKDAANQMLNSKMSCNWANGGIMGDSYVYLGRLGPMREGGKTHIFICKKDLIN